MLCVPNLRIFSVVKEGLSVTRRTARCLSLPARSTYSSSTELEKYLKKLKLDRFQCFQKSNITKPCVEVLKTNYEDLDVVHVRTRQPQVLYLRTELLLQRIGFLKPIGITSRQKRKLIEQNPPVLVLDYDPGKTEGNQVSYLRGVVRGSMDNEERRSLIFHPCTPMIVLRAFDLRNHVQFIQEQLGMAQKSVLQFILNTPSFIIHRRSEMTENCHFIHKHMLPQGFDLDRHTAELYPPVYNGRGEHNPLIHTKLATEDMAASMPLLSLNDILDFSYKEDHGKGQPEDLVEFLTRAEARELRQRYNKKM